MFEQDTYIAGYGEPVSQELPPFETGVGGSVGGEVHIDGTPFRVITIGVAALLLLVVYHQGGFRWHVVV